MTILSTANTAIVYDSTADLPGGLSPTVGWAMVPLTVTFGAESFRDYVDLPIDEFYRRLASSPTSPTTSQPTPGAFAAVYGDLLARFDHVVSLHISGKLSGTVESARLAATEWPDRITVVDSGGVSCLLELAIRGVVRLLERATGVDEVLAFCEQHRRTARAYFAVDTLEYLQRGGRIGKAQALVGQMLAVRPILTVADGELHPAGRVRGAGKVIGALVDHLIEAVAPGTPVEVAIAHAAAPTRADDLAAAVRLARPDAVIGGVTGLGAVVGTHSGPGCLALAFSVAMPKAP